MLTEALILHMADRSDIAKYIDREVCLGRLMQGDESRQQAAVVKCPSNESHVHL